MTELSNPTSCPCPVPARNKEAAWTVPDQPALANTPVAFCWPLAHFAVVPTVYWTSTDADAFDRSRYVQANITLPSHIYGAVSKRQAEYFYGRLCAQTALRVLGSDCAVGTGPRREPIWPDGIVGSITHGGTLAAAVALPSSACHGIGIDIEQTATPEAQQALRHMVVSAREYSVLESVAQRIDIGVLLTLVFSAKESFFKASFGVVGRYFEFDAIEVKAIDPDRCEIVCRVTAPLCAAWPIGMLLSISYIILPQGRVATLFAW